MARYAKNHKNSTSLRHGHNSIKTKRGRSSYNKARYARTKTHSYKKRGRKPSLFTTKHYNYNNSYVNTNAVTTNQSKQNEDMVFYGGLFFGFLFFVCVMSLACC